MGRALRETARPGTAWLRTGLLVTALVLAASTVFTLARHDTRRPPPPVAVAAAKMLLPNGTQLRLDPDDPVIRQCAGEIAAALAVPFHTVERETEHPIPLWWIEGPTPVVEMQFATPVAVNERRVERVRVSGMDRSYRFVELHSSGAIEVVFLLPHLHFRHWRVMRYKRTGDAAFTAAFARLRSPDPPLEPLTLTPTPAPEAAHDASAQ